MADQWRIALLLEGFAALAAAEAQPARAARLAGAAQALREKIGATLRPNQEDLRERRLSPARRAVGEAAFAAAWAEGRAMSLEQAIAEALAPPELPSPASEDGGRSRQNDRSQRLTPREHEVARLIARGLTDRQIAAELVITERTAGSHVEHILRKLGLASRVQIATWAVAQRGEDGVASSQP